MANFRLPEINTRFALPIICPTTGEEVSAETLYNRCCDAMGHVVRDHIGDLILDNLRYPEGETPDEQALCDAVYAWSASVRAQLPAPATVIEQIDAAETTLDEMHSGEPFVTWAFIDDGGERVCIIEYDNLDNAFPFAQELIIRLPVCYGGAIPAEGDEEPPQPVDDGSCDPLYGQRMDSADMGEC